MNREELTREQLAAVNAASKPETRAAIEALTYHPNNDSGAGEKCACAEAGYCVDSEPDVCECAEAGYCVEV